MNGDINHITQHILVDIDEKAETLVRELAEDGQRIASEKFSGALYAGQNDVFVTVENETDGENEISKSVVAKGESVLFIEYGTGIRYDDEHPYHDDYGFFHGEYGKKQGKNPKGWFYIGAQGRTGEPAKNPKAAARGVMHTYGNPANMCMYETAKELREQMDKLMYGED